MDRWFIFIAGVFIATLLVTGCMQSTQQAPLQTPSIATPGASAPQGTSVVTTPSPAPDPILGKWIVVNASGVSGNADFLAGGIGNLQITKDFIPLGSAFTWMNSGDDVHYNATLAANNETIDLTLQDNQLDSPLLPAGAYLEKETS